MVTLKLVKISATIPRRTTDDVNTTIAGFKNLIKVKARYKVKMTVENNFRSKIHEDEIVLLSTEKKLEEICVLSTRTI